MINIVLFSSYKCHLLSNIYKAKQSIDNLFFQDINECGSGPCKNGATCNNGVNGYTCTCSASYTGDTCEEGNIHFLVTHSSCIREKYILNKSLQ